MKIKGDASKARFIAAVIDNLMALVVMLLVVSMVPENLYVIKLSAIVLGYFGYFLLFEGLWSRTPGKYFQGLVIRKLDGSFADWKASLIRSALRIVEINPVLFGGIPAGLILISSERNQRLGDIFAGTVVVSDKILWESNDEPEASLSHNNGDRL